MADVVVSGSLNDKLYEVSGEFTSTVKQSLSIASVDNQPTGICWDGANTSWAGNQIGKMYLNSGLFTGIIKDSVKPINWFPSPSIAGTVFDETDTMWEHTNKGRIYLQSGQFTSTIKWSFDVSALGGSHLDISWDGVDTYTVERSNKKLYRLSGQQTIVVKDSIGVSATEFSPQGVNPSGSDTNFHGNNDVKFYKLSGQFTSTMKTSVGVGVIENLLFGMDIDQIDLRILPTNNVAFNLPSLTLNGIGSSEGVVINLPIPTVSAFGAAGGSVTLPVLTVLATRAPQAFFDLPVLTVAAFSFNVSAPDTAGLVDIDLPILTIESLVGGVVKITLPSLTVSNSTFQGEVGTTGITLPMLVLLARAYNGSAPECVVMNTKNLAVSEYLNYGFNSMTRFNGANLICDQNGIYEQDSSDTDNAGVDDYKIKAHIKSGTIDIHSQTIQRMRNYWLNYQTDGDVEIVVGADKKATRYYFLPYHSGLSGINERRAKPERGIRERHFNFKIRNVNGSDLEIDKLTVTLEPIVSKRR